MSNLNSVLLEGVVDGVMDNGSECIFHLVSDYESDNPEIRGPGIDVHVKDLKVMNVHTLDSGSLVRVVGRLVEWCQSLVILADCVERKAGK